MERHLEVEIPATHDVNFIPKTASPQETLLVKSLPCTYEGKLIKVSYTLKVFVKHEGWNQFGEGSCVMIPVKLVQPPKHI